MIIAPPWRVRILLTSVQLERLEESTTTAKTLSADEMKYLEEL